MMAPPQESELPADHPPQEPLLLLRAKLGAHHHLPGSGGQQSRGGEQKPGECSVVQVRSGPANRPVGGPLKDWRCRNHS